MISSYLIDIMFTQFIFHKNASDLFDLVRLGLLPLGL